jgi:hypothetical protein
MLNHEIIKEKIPSPRKSEIKENDKTITRITPPAHKKQTIIF